MDAGIVFLLCSYPYEVWGIATFIDYGYCYNLQQIDEKSASHFPFIITPPLQEPYAAKNDFITMSLENQIRAFISDVPRGCIFDAHAVILHLLENHPDEYLGFHAAGEPVNTFHGRISQEINKFADNILIERMKADSYSKTITGNCQPNACWKKL